MCWVPGQLGDFSGPGHHLLCRASRSLPASPRRAGSEVSWTPGGAPPLDLGLGLRDWPFSFQALPFPPAPALPTLPPLGDARPTHCWSSQIPNPGLISRPPLEGRTGTQPMKQMFSAPQSPREEGESRLFSFCLPCAFP